ESGFDYVELPLAQMMDLNDEEFFSLKERVDLSGLKCEVCNNFFPVHIRLTGNAVDYGKIEEYLDKALGRAAQLGVKVIVFGSPKSKNVPEGYPMDKAWSQLVELLRTIDPLGRAKGITIVIEPLCKLESNIINTAAEGFQLSRAVDRENIKLLVDYYHLVMEKEDPDIILSAGSYIKHVHFANPAGRGYPVETEDGYFRFVNLLKRIGYEGRMSVEALTKDFSHDAKRSVEILRQLAG
ncbi:MAG TPA: sugar phosphate isomerase/epimerase family protein, partial [Thermodesulfobacteriota bacterium]|nr:sugar phosphate isomerase/epimerase family protein [Thermodesulfobacteriota bacterium]